MTNNIDDTQVTMENMLYDNVHDRETGKQVSVIAKNTGGKWTSLSYN